MSQANRERVINTKSNSNNTDPDIHSNNSNSNSNSNSNNNNNNNINNNNSSSSASSRSESFNKNNNYYTINRNNNFTEEDSTSGSSIDIIKNNNNNKSSIATATAAAAAPVSTSSSYRLSSIEILNENKQRQLQFKQQESFKLHLEQRQKLIQQQQRDSNDESNLGVTYQVNTSAPDFMASAINKKNSDSSAGGSLGNQNKTKVTTSNSVTINPFNNNNNNNDEKATNNNNNNDRQAMFIKRPKSAQGGEADNRQSTTVSGKSGFLSALMDEASFDQTTTTNKLDRSQEELNTYSGNKSLSSNNNSRYSNVVPDRGFNYDDENPDKRPFYQKDFGTLLQECRASRKLVIAIVAIALLLDNMLLTSVVPIIPFDLLKNRMEKKQQANLIQRQQQQQLNGTNRMKALPASGKDSNNNGIDDDLEQSMAKFIDQSIENAKDRYSGSVFHPRVKINNNYKKLQDKDDEDGNGNKDDDDNDDDDDNNNNNRDFSKLKSSNSNNNMKSSRVKSNEMRKMQSSGGQSLNKDGDNNDEEDDGDDDYEDSNERDNDDIEKENSYKDLTNRKKIVINKQLKTNNQNDDDADNDNNNDDDDEDSVNSKRWTKLKSSLISMARTTGNDTDMLANTCLNIVLGGKNNKDDGDDDNKLFNEKQKNVKNLSPSNNNNNNNKRNDIDNKQNRLRTKRSPKISRPKLLVRPIRPQPSTTTTTTTTTSSSLDGSNGSNDHSTKSPKKIDNNELDGMSSVSHQDIVDESFEVGVMFASKPIVQAFANPFIGTLTNKVGFTIPMFTGFVIMFISTLVFAFGSSYSTLFIARAIQGVGSACTSVAGMSMLADRFPDDAERGNAMAIALGGLALGVVIGPPFGGFMYEFVGRSSPFIVLSFLALLDGLLQLLVLQPCVTKSQEEGASLMTLIKDPYILVAAGAITFANTGIAILEPALPLWMMDTMQAKNWEQGVAFLPAALSYMFGTNLFGNLGHKIGRWRSTMIGLIIIGLSLLLIPFATRVEHLIIPNGAIGFAMGMVDSTMMPMLGYLVDIRHTSVYGSVYAIGDVAFCASFAFGPALSGTLVELIGFEGLIITTAMICFCFAPLLLLLKNPPARQLNEAQLQEQSTLRYVNYNHLDSPDEEAHLTGDLYKSNKIEKTYVR